MEDAEAFGWTLIILYILPGIIASVRKHGSAMAIWLVDILLGWTVIFWFVALIWSFTSTGNTIVHIHHHDDKNDKA